MNSDAFVAGVAPGGLTNQNEIKILVCYMVKSVPNSLTPEIIIDVVQSRELANYFEISDAISVLLKRNQLMKNDDGTLNLTDTGKEIADSLDKNLPPVVRERAIETALSVLRFAKNVKENPVEIVEKNGGFDVVCHVSGGDFDLMQVSIFAPDFEQALIIKENFHKEPQLVYNLVVSSLTGEKQYIKDYFSI